MKKIKANSLLFIFIILFVTVFKSIFGDENTLIGVTTLIAFLVLPGEGLLQSIKKNGVILLTINVGTGIVTFIATQHMYLGVFLHFMSFYLMGYFFTKQLDKMILIPFGLQYLFILYAPVALDGLMTRLLALTVGALLIVLVPLLFNKRELSVQTDQKSNILMPQQMLAVLKEKLNVKTHRETQAVRFHYALRLAWAVTFAIFIVDFFSIEQGRWIVYTVFSLTELYHESFKIRSKQRLGGTLMGIFIVVSLFSVIQASFFKQSIMLLGGYLDTYSRNYFEKMTCVTVSVIASGSIVSHTFFVAIERISLVVLGVLIVFIVNKVMMQRQKVHV